MITHILIPSVDLSALEVPPAYEEWLREWLRVMEEDLENGVVCSSRCLQGAISEMVLHGCYKTDWIGIMREYLEDVSGEPLAYSEEFGKKLWKFNQWQQSTVHAIHSRWWIEKGGGVGEEERARYGNLIESLIQANGWIYNPNVSPTGVRTRMKSELMMSMAMGLEILTCTGSVSDELRTSIESTLSDMPRTPYVSAECFRLQTLDLLGSVNLAPLGLEEVVAKCQAGRGYCDFSLELKVDDYMGTAKRTSRDQALHSAVSTIHAKYLSKLFEKEESDSVNARVRDLGVCLTAKPFDIAAFQMRDIDIPFGTGLSPLEIVAASYVISDGS